MKTMTMMRRGALALATLALAAPAAAQRQPPPAPLPARPLQFPAFRETTLPNGLRLIVVENHAHPVASVNLLVGSGSASVPARHVGLAGVFSELLPKGTATRTGSELSGAIERTGGSIGAGSGEDHVNVYASVLSEHLPLAMELVADVTLNPSFPDDEVTAARDRAISQLQQWMADPGYLVNRRFIERLYAGHLYGRYRTPESLAALDRAAMVAFHQAHFKPGNALLVVAGDVDAARVEEMARARFGGWQGGDVQRPAYGALPASTPTRILLVHRPGAVQSSVRAGRPTIRAADADYPALLVLNKIVGGGTDSRLFSILREQKGWTYGAWTDVDRPRDVGRMMAGMDVRSEATDSAVAEMLTQVRRIATEPVTAQELEAAKGYLVGSFPIGIQTAGEVAS
ncbi:MAG TPA: pitrilysin family protein, partial [Longimicrobium sp.]|nr:pitrilysin family protein [Longimicrobium sp.]